MNQPVRYLTLERQRPSPEQLARSEEMWEMSFPSEFYYGFGKLPGAGGLAQQRIQKPRVKPAVGDRIGFASPVGQRQCFAYASARGIGHAELPRRKRAILQRFSPRIQGITPVIVRAIQREGFSKSLVGVR